MKKTTDMLLFVSPKKSSFFVPMVTALQKMGFDVQHFDYLKPNKLASVLGFITNQLPKDGVFHPLFIAFINWRLLKNVQKNKPKYMLVIKGEVLAAQTIETITGWGVTTINWFPDNDSLWKLLIQTATSYSNYFSVCEYLTKKLNKHGIQAHYLPVADVADREIKKVTKKYSIVFVGHRTNRRIAFFSTIADLGFDLWGYKHWMETPLAPYYHKTLSVDELKDIYRQSKIIVNVSTGEEGAPVCIANLRNFEATGVGAFVLSEYNAALAELFREDKEMVFFRSKEELRRKAQYYLEHQQERETIAKRGWLRTKSDHTYIHRLRKLFSYVNHSN